MKKEAVLGPVSGLKLHMGRTQGLSAPGLALLQLGSERRSQASWFPLPEVHTGLIPLCASHLCNFWGKAIYLRIIYSSIQRLSSDTQHTSTVTRKTTNGNPWYCTTRTVAWQQPKEQGLAVSWTLPSFLRPTTGLQWEATLLQAQANHCADRAAARPKPPELHTQGNFHGLHVSSE